ncbi:MAG: TolC family protein [Candidatus Hydrogenedens sp.]|jgi:outer membrane protein TolC|nr:TolC family protein [Candidatus Hydrogenedens sp.]
MRYFGLTISLICAAMACHFTASGQDLDDAIPEAHSETAAADADSVQSAGANALKAAISADLIDLSELRAAAERMPDSEILRLSLNDAVRIAVDNNPDILIAELEPEKAEAENFAAHGEFDPIFQHTFSFTRAALSLNQQLRTFAGVFMPSAIDSRSFSNESALAGKLTTGTQYALQFQVDFDKNTYGGSVGEYGATLGLMLTQPVLRGFGKDVNRIRIRASSNLKELSEAQLKLVILNKTADTIKAYWDLVGATEAVRVYEGALRNAERLLTISETRRDIGTAADIDVLQAKAGVAMRQSELIQAFARISDAGDALKLLLNMKDNDRFSPITILPLDRPDPSSNTFFDANAFEESLEISVEKALELRPENIMTDLEIANALLEEEKARNDMLPQVDFVGLYARGGRNTLLGRTLAGIRDNQDYTYNFGIQASIPINNRAGRGAHQRARLGVRQAEERRKQALMALMMRIHVAARGVVTGKTLVESNHQTTLLQETNVMAEEKRLKIGISNSYQVLKVQEDLTAAQVSELQASIAFEKALVELQLAEGSLLDNLGIQWNHDPSIEPVSWIESVGLLYESEGKTP